MKLVHYWVCVENCYTHLTDFIFLLQPQKILLNQGTLFQVDYNDDQITQQCTDEVVPKWIDQLGAVDLFTYDHCWKISESQRID